VWEQREVETCIGVEGVPDVKCQKDLLRKTPRSTHFSFLLVIRSTMAMQLAGTSTLSFPISRSTRLQRFPILMVCLALHRTAVAFSRGVHLGHPTRKIGMWCTSSSSSRLLCSSSSTNNATETTTTRVPPWNMPHLQEKVALQKRNNKARFRQHVNPLSANFQQPTLLPDDWPLFDDCRRPLHLDIGCGKGGFLVDLAEQENNNNNNCFNYLGLEIRPGVATYAKQRVEERGLAGHLDFLGCNANVDLERVLTLYCRKSKSSPNKLLQRVTIQFPDPHFKVRKIG